MEISAKSHKRYELTYECFKKWLSERSVKIISEKVMLLYMLERSQKLKSPNSLWCEYSMLKTTINQKEKVDISKFPKLKAFLKRKNQGYKPKKSKVLNREDIVKFFQDAPDELYLLMKTVMVIGIAGACRSDEFCKMQMKDIRDMGNFVIITIPESKNGLLRTFTIVDNTEESINYLGTFKKYLEIRMRVTSTNSRFFLRYQSGKCMNQPVGKHTFAKIPSIIAKFLKLPESHLYTGHCFRRSSATLLANSGANVLGLKRHGGIKSTMIPESYVSESVANKIDMARKILCNPSSSSSTFSHTEHMVREKVEPSNDELQSEIQML